MGTVSGMGKAGRPDATRTGRRGGSRARELSARELLSALQRGDGLLLVDVRSEGAYARGHLPGAISVPYAQADPALLSPSIAADQPIVVYCYIGIASAKVALMLEEAGFSDVRSLAGGHTAWRLLKAAPADVRGR